MTAGAARRALGAAAVIPLLLAQGCTPTAAATPNKASAGEAASRVSEADFAIAEAPWEPGPLPIVPGLRAKRSARRDSTNPRFARAALEDDGPRAAPAGAPTTGMVLDGGVLGHDPQVAVGDRYLIVYTAHRYRILDKATGRLLAGEDGDEIAPRGDFSTLFSPLWAPRDKQGNPNRANVNARLHYVPSDPLICDPEAPTASRACVQEFYDTRILWDPARKRFWIESAARNHLWNCKPTSREPCTAEKWTQTQARRFIAVAVSRTEDPRKGFHRYILVEKYSDWPKIGLQNRYLVLGHRSEAHAYVFDADKLAAGNPGRGPVRLARLGPDAFPGARFLAPVTHESPTGNMTFLVGTDGSDRVIPFGLFDPGGAAAAPPVVITGPALSIGHELRTIEGNAVHRDGRLYMTWDECAPEAERCAYRRVRVTRIPVSATGARPPAIAASTGAGFLSLAFGGREPDDAPGDVIDYKKPALDVNRRGDVVIVYSRRGVRTRSPLFPEVRYSILYGGEAAPRPGVLLARGTTGDLPDINDNAAAGIDLAYAQVDPSDDHTVWVTHAYADQDAGWFKQIVAAVKP